ncbi:MAG: hypothetical protein IPM18_17630 [Phycisphaerales bacterium]|nr:hypothetical protein [Phycisphaerales bacterium]
MKAGRLGLVIALACAWVGTAGGEGLLVIPNSALRAVWAFDPFDGALVDDAFIVDTENLRTPHTPIDSGRGTILISDQTANAVFEYAYDGTYLGRIVDQPNHGIQNLRGIALHDGQLYVTVAAGPHSGTVQRFELDGTGQSTFASGIIASPYYVLFREHDVLVPDSNDHNLERFTLAGAPLPPFHNAATSALRFPQQVYARGNGNLYVAGFSAVRGIYEFDATGTQLNFYDVGNLGVRGVWELGNGRILYCAAGTTAGASGGTVGVLDPTTGVYEVVVASASWTFRHVAWIPVPTPPAACPGDANGDTVVDFADISPFIAALKAGSDANWTCDLDAGYGPYLNSDANGDGVVSFADISPFIALLKNPPAACVSQCP